MFLLLAIMVVSTPVMESQAAEDVIENIYEEGDVVRVETGDSYIRLEPKLYEEVPVGEGEKFVHGKDYIILYKMEEEECF